MSGSRSDDSDDATADVDADVRPRGRRKRTARAPLGRRARVLRVVKWVALGGAGAGVLGVLVLTGLLLYYGSDPRLPNLKKLSDYKPPQVTLVLDREGKLLGKLGSAQQR